MTTYDRTTALVVIDVQNDFADPRGSLHVPNGDEILPLVNAEIAAGQEAGAPVYYTQDWHPPSTPHFEKDGGIWPVHCVQDTWGAEFHPELTVDGPIVRKGDDGRDGYSGFSARDPRSGEVSVTPLHSMLKAMERERLIVCGLASDYCVLETVLDAVRLGYRVEVREGAIRAVDLHPGDGQRAIEGMRASGATIA
ncbi:MAG: isochorismatase family protein [Actinomycetota bacterium]